ncbi:GAF domain-containing protein [Desulfobacter hydrogenophilus]|uniref:GAF domain-containing protein n=2 Tax=Desulfobacter hydrogenophilus TaxID=2291 RepID=A0ABX5RBW7_9BACT|nr:GAF domain-containing protein [Desulfobacter hydrogenophilus]NDY71307.1 GAF domain-containing protein [Desulfobacter hydrogenophilus]QBH12291.1 GAF domain-containing protein [Desulfobacter hydrogenophilus]
MASLRKTNRILRTLNECSHTLIRAKDEFELMQDICRIVVELGGYRLAWIGSAEDNQEQRVRPVVHRGYEKDYLKLFNMTWTNTQRRREPTGSAIRNSAPSVFQNILTNPNYEVWRKEALKRGYASAAALPLKKKDKPFGALSICAAEPNAFGKDELQLLEELAGVIRTALENETKTPAQEH